MIWDKKQKKWSIKIRNPASDPDPGSIRLPDPDTGAPTVVPRLECNTSEKALGAFTRPDSNMDDQIAYL